MVELVRLGNLHNVGYATHAGGRQNNEDSLLVHYENGKLTLAVADGLAGHPDGEKASMLAVMALKERLSLDLRNGFGYAHALVLAQQPPEIVSGGISMISKDDLYKLMGTTLTALRIKGNESSFGHVGDSKLFHIRFNHLKQLTVDHTKAQEKRDRGLIVRPDGEHELTKFVGIYRQKPQYDDLTLKKGDVLVLCTDGLTNTLTLDEIKSICLQNNQKVAAKKLVETANQTGINIGWRTGVPHDNITAIVYKHS